MKSSDTCASRRDFIRTVAIAAGTGGVVVAPRGSTVFGVLAEAKKSGRLAGKSELTTVLTDIMINNQLVPIATSGVKVGVGASILTSGSQVYIPRGTLLEYTLGAELRPM